LRVWSELTEERRRDPDKLVVGRVVDRVQVERAKRRGERPDVHRERLSSVPE
jgi:hypothetical protein